MLNTSDFSNCREEFLTQEEVLTDFRLYRYQERLYVIVPTKKQQDWEGVFFVFANKKLRKIDMNKDKNTLLKDSAIKELYFLLTLSSKKEQEDKKLFAISLEFIPQEEKIPLCNQLVKL